MSPERFFITGAFGCIGAWVVRALVKEGVPTTLFDVATDPHRLRLIMSDDELARVRVVEGDITDLEALQHAMGEANATHVIHLAALQVPFCRADPPQGARVNVVGTVNLFEAARRLGLGRVVYASSIAVYGSSEDYPEDALPADAPLYPRTHYGVYKQANEGAARVYYLDQGLSSIGLRPYTVYGPGRDQGLTSGPTQAMLAAAVGRPYHIGFGGRCTYQYAPDVASALIHAARVPFSGAAVYNLPGDVLPMRDVVAAIESAVPTAQGQITFEDVELPFPAAMDATPIFDVLGAVQRTPLTEAVAETITSFQQAIGQGRLTIE